MLLKNYKFYSYITTLDESEIKCYNLVIIRRDSGLPLVWAVSLKREKIKKFYKEDFHMKNLNKVLAMLVVFMMMLSTVAFASSFSDVADTSSYNKAIEVGVDLGLFKGYEDGTFKPEGEITRAEFAAIVVRLLGQEAQANGAKASTQFIDVPADHWAAGYVNIAVQAGVINGYGNGNFGPEDLVEYQDAITMMVRALGYEPAIGSAGYPTGYLTKAGELGLTTGVNGSNGVAANRGAVAQIAFNSIDVPIMTQSGYGTFTQYVINDGYSSTMGTTNVKKTLLSENHSIIKLQGTVKDSSDISSTSTTVAPSVTFDITDGYKNKFSIASGEKKIYVGETDAAAYVGKKVVLFAAYDEFEDKLTAKALYEVAVDSIVIDIADVDAFTDEGIKYYVNESKTTTATIDYENVNVFYNGVEIDYADLPEELLDMSGSIELALIDDETTTADYDTMYVTAYDVFVVDEVNATAQRVTSKIDPLTFRNRISYNEEEGDVLATLYDANGAEMDWANLEEYDVLMVKYVVSGAKTIYEAKIVENTVTGTVTGISGEVAEDDRYVEIDGTEYKVSGNAEVEKEMKLGNEGTYYLDDNNNVVYHSATITRSNNYAYVIALQPATEMDNAKAKVLTKENGIVTVEVANKVTVTYQGEKETNVSTKSADFNDKAADFLNKIVTYKLNSAGQLSAVEIPSVGEQNEDYLCENASGDLMDYDVDGASFKLGGKKYYITESTVIFYVGAEDEDDYEVVALNNLSDGQDLEGAVIYDADDDRYVGAIILTEEQSIAPSVENATFVTKISDTTDEDGYDVVRVTGYKGLEEVSYICDETDINLGDLVVPVYKANGDVNYFDVVDSTEVVDEDNDAEYVFGTLETYVEDEEELSPVNTKKKFIYLDGEEYKIDGSVNIYVYDTTLTTRNKYKVGEGLGYVEFDVEEDTVYVNGEEADVTVDVAMYIYDGDVVDLVYFIYEGR